MAAAASSIDPGADLRKNVELKARQSDLIGARAIAAQIATRSLGRQHQIDTYFHAPLGRLKLRQIDGLSAVLIAYRRPDEAGSKVSDYRLVPIADPESLKGALADSLGIRVVVDKQREVFLWNKVRIHLDQVRELGSFIEFEAVLGPGEDEAMGRTQVAEMKREFRLSERDLIEGSYSDLLLEKLGRACAATSFSPGGL